MRKVFKIFLYILCGILILVLGVVVWLNTPSGKNFVRTKAEAFLRKKLKTEVHIGGLGYGLPKFVVLEDVLFKDQAKDTLLAVKKLKVDINMLALIRKKVDVQQLLLEGVHAHVYRNIPDTNYNFTYIITAFTGNKPKKPKEPKKEDTSSSSLSINVDRVQLDDIHVRFDDYTGGMRLGLDLEHLLLKVKKIDLDSMQFHVKELDIAGLNTTFAQDTSYLPPKVDTSTKQAKLRLVADKIDLQRINVGYNNNLNKFLFDLNLGALAVKLKTFDLEKHLVALDKLDLDTTNIKLVMGKHTTPPAPVDSIVKVDTTEGWRVNAGDINLTAINFLMDNENKPRQPQGIDYSHLNVQHLVLNMQDLTYTSDSILGNIKHLSVQEQSGLDLRELRTKFAYNQQGAILRDLYVQTPNTILQNYLQVTYPSLDALKTRMQAMQLKVNLTKSIVGLHDVLLFAPQLRKQELFRKYGNGHLQLEATITGFLNALDISHFYLAGMDNTEIDLTGKLNGLPDANALSYNMNIAKLQSSRSDLSALLPPKALASVRLPDRFGISGHVAGTAKDYNTNLLLMSTDGGAYLNGTIAMSPGKGRERYDMYVKTMQLNVGRILKKDSLMGRISAAVTVKGRSFDVKTMNAVLDGMVQSAEVKGYNYRNITFKGNMANRVGDVRLNSADPNVHINLNAHADVSGKYAAVKAVLKIDSMDLHALHLYASELRLHGVMIADFPELNPDYPRGTFTWQQPIIVANGQRYTFDSLYVKSNPNADTGQNIVADLNVLQARITGHTPLTKIADIIKDHINRHGSLPLIDSTQNAQLMAGNVVAVKSDTTTTDTTRPPQNYDLQLAAHVEDVPLLHSVLPGLTSMDTIGVYATVTPRVLTLNAYIPEVVYGSSMIENGKVNVNGTDSAFTYKVTVDRIAQNKMQFWFANIHGNLDQNAITTNVSIGDSAKKERFALAALIQKQGDTQVIQLRPGLVLDYKKWQVAQPNKIALAPAGMYVQNFDLSNGNQYIKVNSQQPVPNTPLRVDISNFLLANITEIISKDTLLANGLLGGNVVVNKFKPSPQINADLQIQNLSVMNDTIGNLALKVNNEDDNALNTKLNITGNQNDVALTGKYYMKPYDGNNFDFNLNINALNIASIEGLTMNNIKNSSGFIRGDLHIQGTPSAPLINGQLRTDQLATTVSMLNAYFKMPADQITFTNTGISFNNFEILDSAGNRAKIDGTVGMKDLTNPQLDLHLTARNWRALHSTALDNKTFYGDLLLSTNLNVKGTPSSPNVDGNLKIQKGTDVTVVMPDKNPSIESRAGIVEFVDMSDSNRHLLQPKPQKDSTKVVLAAGSNINVNINVDKNAQFSLIIDQASGDFLRVRGDASLNASVSPGGNMALTGNYELNEGAYQLNYNFIKRKFSIQKGSSIIFAGNPVKANVDITAVYEANIAPYELVEREVADPNQLNYYKQNLPFNVALHMRGSILQPTLTFDIILPENKLYPLAADQIELIRGKLNQMRTDTSELNKQVFAVLILNRFVEDDPFSNSTGGGLAFTAKQSVSRFIGEQLNKFANQLVKGVDLSVDLASTEDYTTGSMRERTDLNLAASKRLLNDRLKLTVGNDFELEGPQTTSGDQTTYIPSNLAADYALTPDGRYSVRAYRRTYDEGVLEGYVTETGVDFIVSLSYNKFKNIFRKRHRHKKDNKEAAGTTAINNSREEQNDSK